MRLRKVRVVLDCEEQLRQGIVEAPGKKQRDAECTENLAKSPARAEAQRSLEERVHA
jgi:hypothetical protein